MIDKINMCKESIKKFLKEEYGHTDMMLEGIFEDMTSIPVAYTTHEDTDQEINVEIDLENFKIIKYLDGIKHKEEVSKNIDEFNEYILSNLDFGDLINM